MNHDIDLALYNRPFMLLKRNFLIILILFLVRLLIQTQIIVPFYRCAWPGISTGVFFTTSGDTESYTRPWIYLVEKGIYSTDGTTPSAIRPPYPGSLFGISYFITHEKVLSMEITSVIQILLGVIAVYFMALLCKDIWEDIFKDSDKAHRAALLYLFLSMFSFHTLFFDGAILSDGPATAFLSFFSYNYYHYLRKNNKTTYLFISGIFMALVTLYRPYYAAFYPVLCFHLLYHLWRVYNSIGFLLSRALIFILPVIILDLPWIIRNYIIFHRLMPFQLSTFYAASQECTTYISIARQVITFTDAYYACPNALCYYETHPDSQCSRRFPRYILGKKLNMEEIQKINMIHRKYAYSDSSDKEAGNLLIQSAKKMLEYYKMDHPYTYWLWPRLYVLKKFLIHGGTFYFPPFHKGIRELNPLLFISLKLLQSGLYWFCLILGTLGLFYLFILRSYTSYLLLIPLYLIFFFCAIFLHYESRYFFASYPILLLGAVFTLNYLIPKLKNITLTQTLLR